MAIPPFDVRAARRPAERHQDRGRSWVWRPRGSVLDAQLRPPDVHCRASGKRLVLDGDSQAICLQCEVVVGAPGRDETLAASQRSSRTPEPGTAAPFEPDRSQGPGRRGVPRPTSSADVLRSLEDVASFAATRWGSTVSVPERALEGLEEALDVGTQAVVARATATVAASLQALPETDDADGPALGAQPMPGFELTMPMGRAGVAVLVACRLMAAGHYDAVDGFVAHVDNPDSRLLIQVAAAMHRRRPHQRGQHPENRSATHQAPGWPVSSVLTHSATSVAQTKPICSSPNSSHLPRTVSSHKTHTRCSRCCREGVTSTRVTRSERVPGLPRYSARTRPTPMPRSYLMTLRLACTRRPSRPYPHTGQ